MQGNRRQGITPAGIGLEREPDWDSSHAQHPPLPEPYILGNVLNLVKSKALFSQKPEHQLLQGVWKVLNYNLLPGRYGLTTWAFVAHDEFLLNEILEVRLQCKSNCFQESLHLCVFREDSFVVRYINHGSVITMYPETVVVLVRVWRRADVYGVHGEEVLEVEVRMPTKVTYHEPELPFFYPSVPSV